MNDLYDLIPDCRVALKLKVLAQIRVEVGQDEVAQQQPEAASMQGSRLVEILATRFGPARLCLAHVFD